MAEAAVELDKCLAHEEDLIGKEICQMTENLIRDHEKEGIKMIQLGDMYKARCVKGSTDREHYVNAVALYNSASAFLNAAAEDGSNVSQYQKKIPPLCNEVEMLYLKNILRQSDTSQATSKLTKIEIGKTKKEELTSYRCCLKGEVEKLMEVWKACPKPEEGIGNHYNLKINDLTRLICQNNTKFIKEFSAEIMEQCISMCGPPPCRFTMVGLGSLARGETTPYSDMEYLFLTESNRFNEYFLDLHFYFQIQVLNFGETPLPAVGIPSLNNFYQQNDDNDFFDDVTPSGFKLDGNMPWAAKIPPGHKKTVTKDPLSLIGTPIYMATLSTTEADKKHGYHLATIISTSTYIMGDEELFKEFESQLALVRSKEDKQALSSVCLERTIEDCMKYAYAGWSNEDLFSKHAKKDYYRFPSILINNLKDLYMINKSSPWEIIEELSKELSQEMCSHLLFMINVVIGIRLFTYCFKNQQHDSIQVWQQFQSSELPVSLVTLNKVSRENLTIPFPKLMQHYLLRYISTSESITDQLTNQTDMNPQFMKSVFLFCDCKLCILRVKMLTKVESGDVIDDPDAMFASVKTSWHQHKYPVTKTNVIGKVQFCHSLNGDHQARLDVLLDAVHSDQFQTKYDKTYHLHNIASSHYDLGNKSEALKYIDDAIALAESNPASISVIWHCMISKAEFLFSYKEYDSLKQCCRKIIQMLPQCEPGTETDTGNANMYYYYSAALIDSKEYEEALDCLIKARSVYVEVFGESHQNYKDVLKRMITCYYALGKVKEAQYFEKKLSKEFFYFFLSKELPRLKIYMYMYFP
ncbi:unnamed protein product [Owenia fusiformis]|uniref:Uncharacterized protein n=1 Tax=Owenia fusiformis TaxID=6347 RepID=A0A8J1U176_OWEFU|nr:unnamed protein product [Owenia fusiformis]